MDPWSALGAASSIITFIDFAWKLLGKTKQAYKSTSGNSDALHTLDLIIRDIDSMATQLDLVSSRSQTLRNLVSECKSLAAELLALFSKLQVTRKNKTWQSLETAIRETLNKDKVAELADRLNAVRAQITTHVQFLLLNQVSEVVQSIQTIHETGKRMEIERAGELLKLKSQVVAEFHNVMGCQDGERLSRIEREITNLVGGEDALGEIQMINGTLADKQMEEDYKKDLLAMTKVRLNDGEKQERKEAKNRSPAEEKKRREEEEKKRRNMEQRRQKERETLSKDLRDLVADMVRLQQRGASDVRNQHLLKSLWFRQMDARHRQIEQAHRETFDWIFMSPQTQQNSPRFVEWLRNENGVFWIHGKPGSGKSTLMKFIWQDPRTIKHLTSWTCGRMLVTAKCFFWNSGTQLQKSLEGLLRSLLFEILRRAPELIPRLRIAQERLRHYDIDFDAGEEGSWSREELLDLFQEIIDQKLPMKFCFFIDGLDEYQDETKSHRKLLDMLKRISDSEDIKLLVSSRPWTEFIDEFGENKNSLLKLEDLTRGDISRYVRDKFMENRHFRERSSDLANATLVEQVTTRAQGVFLWVVLVVRDLLNGFTYSDSIRTLQRRLETFPSDLASFFRRMLDSVPDIYKAQTWRSFEVALMAERPVLLVTFGYLDELDEDGVPAQLQIRTPITKAELHSIQKRTTRRLDGRCRGLLEVVVEDLDEPASSVQDKYFKRRVDFLHRTVRDFLIDSAEVTAMMNKGRENESSSETAFLLCHAVLQAIKMAPTWKGVGKTDIPELTRDLLAYAHRAEPSVPERSLIALLKDAERTYYILVSERVGAAFGGTNFNKASIMQRCREEFLGWACQHDVLCWVKRRLDSTKYLQIQGGGRPLLDFALLNDTDQPDSPVSLRMVEALVKRGADPNARYEGSTPWGRFVSRLRESQLQVQPVGTIQTLYCLVKAGANLDEPLGTAAGLKKETLSLPTSGLDGNMSITAKQVLARILQSRQASMLWDNDESNESDDDKTSDGEWS
ncbi:hypothetical protein GQ53DRAFT_846311 [Thozetella sp. PMI_491]|nr:hypothetical protein GQ53DRAFT_846311 [Thozetella sp. PMI_491]